MKSKYFYTLGGLALLLAIYYFYFRVQTAPDVAKKSVVPEYVENTVRLVSEKEIVFSGRVEQYDDACTYDGVCRLKIGDKWLITDMGGDPLPGSEPARGYSVNPIESSQYLGADVEVYAKVLDDDTLTLYGDNAYYLLFENEDESLENKVNGLDLCSRCPAYAPTDPGACPNGSVNGAPQINADCYCPGPTKCLE